MTQTVNEIKTLESLNELQKRRKNVSTLVLILTKAEESVSYEQNNQFHYQSFLSNKYGPPLKQPSDNKLKHTTYSYKNCKLFLGR